MTRGVSSHNEDRASKDNFVLVLSPRGQFCLGEEGRERGGGGEYPPTDLWRLVYLTADHRQPVSFNELAPVQTLLSPPLRDCSALVISC